jgi:Xaa-Pro dipeptidase
MTSPISRIEKLDYIQKAGNIDAFLFTSSSSVKYFSGYFFYFEYGSSPFHLLPAILMIDRVRDASLVIADNEMGQSEFVDPKIRLRAYESYTYEKAPDPAAECLARIVDFIRSNKLEAARIGIERDLFPFIIAEMLAELYPRIVWKDIKEEVSRLKSVKDPDEIECIRRAAALSDIGQEAVVAFAKAGMTELELFAIVHGKMEKAVGSRVPLMSDLSTGTNTNSGGGMPTNRKIASGDLILSDFQACLQGYWGDSCSTIVVGTATEEQKKTWKLVHEALEIGINTIKPGVEAREVDRKMRAHIGNYPHHSGHSVGTLYHESPRITPYNNTQLKPGMTIALEPAIYKEHWGIRLEHLMLVHSSGTELITKFKHRLEI